MISKIIYALIKKGLQKEVKREKITREEKGEKSSKIRLRIRAKN